MTSLTLVRPAGQPPRAAVVRAAGRTPWYLAPFATVRPHEVGGVALMAAHVFLLLASYYLLKTAREPLILVHGGAEVKSYAAAAQALLLVLVVKGFAALSRRIERPRLVIGATLFFASHLVVFAALTKFGTRVGVPFFLWTGVFNVAVLAQFWSFATEAYTPEQGKRLFGIIGVGSSLGAIFGARVARLATSSVGPTGLMLLAGGGLLLAAAVAALNARVRRGPRDVPSVEVTTVESAPADGFALLTRSRYLQLVAGLALLLTIVNTTGEYVLDKTLLGAAASQTALPAARFVGEFKARYFEWVNLVGVALQLFVVSRFLQHAGVRAALLVLPVVAFGGYAALALAPLLSVVFAAKVAENSLDYSLQNTTRQTLFLPAAPELKLHGKALVDTVLVRTGDVIAAALVWVGQRFAFGPKQFALFNVALVLGWVLLAVAVGLRYQRMARRAELLTTSPERQVA